MALSDALHKQALTHRVTNVCPVARLMDTMPDEDRETLEQALAGPLSANLILRALRAEGYQVGRDSLYAHRRSGCLCARK